MLCSVDYVPVLKLAADAADLSLLGCICFKLGLAMLLAVPMLSEEVARADAVVNVARIPGRPHFM